MGFLLPSVHGCLPLSLYKKVRSNDSKLPSLLNCSGVIFPPFVFSSLARRDHVDCAGNGHLEVDAHRGSRLGPEIFRQQS